MVNGNTQSQTQKKIYHPNGVINCLYVGSLNKKNKSIYQNAIPYLIPKLEAYDLDTEDDLRILKKIF